MDIQLNITTSEKKPKTTRSTAKQNESSGFKMLSKPVVTGKVIARKRKQTDGLPRFKPAENTSDEAKTVTKEKRKINTNKTNEDLGTRLKDLSENKGKFKDKNLQDLSDDIKVKAKPRTGGWISSLFKNNPSVPKMGQRAVKPIVEEVFSGKLFADLDIHSHSIANIQQNLELKELTTVQQMSVPIILQGRDVLIRSQTGSGKTLAFALPIVEGLQAIRPKINRHDGIRVVIIIPTRELAVQTYELFIKLVKPFTWVVPGLLSGGQKRKAEKARLRKGLNILIGTPGRVCDHLRHTQSLNFSKTRCLVLDEADRLLDMGYEKDVAEIVKAIDQHKLNTTYNPMEMIKSAVRKKFDDNEDTEDKQEDKPEVDTESGQPKHNITKVMLSNERQTILLSATLSKAVENLAGITMKDPVFVDSSEGKAPLVADSLKTVATAKKVDIDKTVVNEKIQNEGEEIENEEGNKTENERVGRKGLKPFVGSRFGDLFEKATEKLLISKGLQSATEEDDSDSDYDYFKEKNKTQLQEASEEEIEGAKVDNFQKAIETAIMEDKIVLPSTVTQNFIITPMKLRLVTLCASIVEHCALNKKGGKMIVFMATQEMVDYHSDILEIVLTETGKNKEKKGKKNAEDDKEDKDDNKDSSDDDLPSDFEVPLPGEPGLEGLIPISLEIFKLFGSMPHEERIEVFKKFRKAKAGVLFCTDVAARGLDLPKVDLVFQYCAPTSVTDYVHRVGRTGRAACVGAAILLLLPTESDYVRLLEEKRIRLKQLDDKTSLEPLRTIVPTASSAARAAVCIQARIEKTVHTNKDWLKRASRAYTSWVRFYAGYPRAVREYLDSRTLHLGHAAKSFGLRDPPGTVARRVKNDPEANKAAPSNRLTVDKESDAKRPGFQKMKVGDKRPVNKQSSMHTASEFDSGLEPSVKKKKKK